MQGSYEAITYEEKKSQESYILLSTCVINSEIEFSSKFESIEDAEYPGGELSGDDADC